MGRTPRARHHGGMTHAPRPRPEADLPAGLRGCCQRTEFDLLLTVVNRTGARTADRTGSHPAARGGNSTDWGALFTQRQPVSV